MDALDKSKDIPNRIVLMHHPPVNWLKDFETGNTRMEMFRQCRLLLHGHTHSDNALVFKDPADQCICLGANASYTDDKEGFIGFQFVEVEYIKKGIKVKVWPVQMGGKAKRVRAGPGTLAQPGRKPLLYNRGPWNPRKTESRMTCFAGIPEEYRKWLAEFHSVLPMDQLARKGEAVLISLPAVYIPLETSNPFHKPMDETDMKKGKGSKKEPKEPPTIDIEELMGRVNCLLLERKGGNG